MNGHPAPRYFAAQINPCPPFLSLEIPAVIHSLGVVLSLEEGNATMGFPGTVWGLGNSLGHSPRTRSSLNGCGTSVYSAGRIPAGTGGGGMKCQPKPTDRHALAFRQFLPTMSP